MADDAYRDFWLSRTDVEGPRATRFHGDHDPYDLAAIAALGGDGVTQLLDLGCGTCEVANRIVGELGWSVHAVDYVEAFLENAIDDSRLTTEVGDVRTYRGADNAYDMIILLGVITYLQADERADLYARCRAMLRPGGTLLIKAQMGVRETVEVDNYSEQFDRHYRATYPYLEAEVADLRAVFGDDAVTVTDPYPPSFSRFDNTHFHHLIARRPA